MKAFLDFMHFRKLVSPGIIKMTFWLGCVGSVVACIKILVDHGPIQQAISVLIITPLFIRLVCEFMLGVVSLTDVARHLHDAKTRS